MEVDEDEGLPSEDVRLERFVDPRIEEAADFGAQQLDGSLGR